MSRPPAPDPSPPLRRATDPPLPGGRVSPANLYVAAVLLCGLAAVAHALLRSDPGRALADPTVWLLTAGVVVSELFPVRIRRDGQHGEIAPSTTFCFALLITAGETAVVLVAAASLLADAILAELGRG